MVTTALPILMFKAETDIVSYELKIWWYISWIVTTMCTVWDILQLKTNAKISETQFLN